MGHIVWTIVIGFFAGLLAKMLTPGSGPGGFFMTAVLGIAGSLLASYLGQALGWYSAQSSQLSTESYGRFISKGQVRFLLI